MQNALLETVRKAKQGDHEASTELYHKTVHMVFCTALKFTGNEDVAQDIAGQY